MAFLVNSAKGLSLLSAAAFDSDSDRGMSNGFSPIVGFVAVAGFSSKTGGLAGDVGFVGGIGSGLVGLDSGFISGLGGIGNGLFGLNLANSAIRAASPSIPNPTFMKSAEITATPKNIFTFLIGLSPLNIKLLNLSTLIYSIFHMRFSNKK
jgi:hypothetical protein